MKKSRLLGAVCAYIGMVGIANATTVDFQDVTSGNCSFNENLVTSQGFDFTGNPNDPALFVCNAGLIGNNTSAALIDANSLSIVSMSSSGGESFSLQSFFAGSRTELGNTSSVDSAYGLSTGVDVVGTLFGGGTVTTSFNFSFLDFDQFTLPSSFNNLTSVTFTSIGGGETEFLIDDIVASTVPIPAAIWLFGSGLLGLVGIARRKKAV